VAGRSVGRGRRIPWCSGRSSSSFRTFIISDSAARWQASYTAQRRQERRLLRSYEVVGTHSGVEEITG
jgi:hypothetical protein